MSQPVAYIMTVFIAVMAAVKVFFQNDFVKKYSHSDVDIAIYMTSLFALISIFLAFFVDFTVAPHWLTVVFAIAWGVFNSAGQIMYSKAMKVGHVSLTVLIVMFSMVVPAIYGVFAWDKPISIMQYIGLVIVAVAFVLILYKPTHKSDDKSVAETPSADGAVSKKKSVAGRTLWLILVFGTFVFFGAMSIVSTQHQMMFPDELNWFVFLCYLSSVMIMGTFALTKRKQATVHINKKVVMDVFFGAAALGLHNYFRPMISRYLAPVILSSLSSVLNIVIVTLVGVWVLKEGKLSKKQWLGMALSGISIVCLCL